MNANLTRRLKKIASILPEKWEKSWETMYMTGKEANLCFIGKRPYKDDAIVEFKCPRFVKINHYRKLKDGVNKSGQAFIGQYVARMDW